MQRQMGSLGYDLGRTAEITVSAHMGAADQTWQMSVGTLGDVTRIQSGQALNLGQTGPGRGL